MQVGHALTGHVSVPDHTRMHAMQVQAFEGTVRRLYIDRRQSGTASVRGVGPHGGVHETETATELAKVQVAVVHGNGHGGWSDVFDEQILNPEVHRVLDEQRMSCVASHVAVKATNVTRIGLNVIGAEVVKAGLLAGEDAALSVVRRGEVAQFHAPTVLDERTRKAVPVQQHTVDDHLGHVDPKSVFGVAAEVPRVALH